MPTPTRGTPEASTGVHDATRRRERTTLANSCRCGARWSGVAAAHCAAECHLTFTGVTAFDIHRRGGQCRIPGDVGLVAHQRAGYLAFGKPGDDANTARFTSRTEEATR